MIRIAIVDDDESSIRQLTQYVEDLGRESGNTFQVTAYRDGDELVERYRSQFDIILLDVEMPFLNGMDAAELIRRQDSEVVIMFITNMAQYAIQGYSVNALDYILKPVNRFSFAQRLGRAMQHIKKKGDAYITVPVKGGALKLEIDSIFYIERLGRQLMFHTRSGIHASPTTLQQVEESLEGKGFARCNKGYLVNLEHVDGIRDGCAVVRGDKLLISRGRRGPFLEALADRVGGVAP